MALTQLIFITSLFTCTSTSAIFCKEKELGYICCANFYWDEKEEKCSKCMPGYLGLNCSDRCEDGYYGQDCASKCPEICTTCNNVNGNFKATRSRVRSCEKHS